MTDAHLTFGAHMLLCRALEEMDLGESPLCLETKRRVRKLAEVQRATIQK